MSPLFKNNFHRKRHKEKLPVLKNHIATFSKRTEKKILAYNQLFYCTIYQSGDHPNFRCTIIDDAVDHNSVY